MANLVCVVPILWLCLFPVWQTRVIVLIQVWLVVSGNKFGAYRFPIRRATLYGELAVRLSSQRLILLEGKWCWIIPMSVWTDG